MSEKSPLRLALEGLVNRWAVGGNGIDAASVDLISACSAELLRVLDEHPEEPQDAQDWERRTQAAGTAPQAEPARYALVEQMGHRATVAVVSEATFCGKAMLAVTDLKTGSDHLISPESLYEVTWLTEDEARARTRPWTAVALPAADRLGADEEDDDDPDVAENGGVWSFTEADL